jgi:hypothetical protein
MAQHPAPLDDPAYDPEHSPIAGQVPDVVAKWGPRSQLRWFRRFGTELAPRRDWDRFYCASEHHRGACCLSCWDEGDMGVLGVSGEYCCCRDERMGC